MSSWKQIWKWHKKETDEGPQKVECEQPVGYCTLLYILTTDNVDFNSMQIKNFTEVKEWGLMSEKFLTLINFLQSSKFPTLKVTYKGGSSCSKSTDGQCAKAGSDLKYIYTTGWPKTEESNEFYHFSCCKSDLCNVVVSTFHILCYI